MHTSWPGGARVESSPLIDGNRVFVGSNDGKLYALDARTGAPRWKFATDGEFYHSNVGLSPLTVQIQGGKVTVIGPAKDAAKAEYPMTAWNKR